VLLYLISLASCSLLCLSAQVYFACVHALLGACVSEVSRTCISVYHDLRPLVEAKCMPGHCCNQTFGTQKRHQRRQSIELHMSISAIMHVCNPETFTLASTKQQVRLLFTASCGAAWSSSTSCYAAPAERAGQAGYVSRVTGTLQKCTLGRPGSTQRSDICKRQTLANEHMPRSCRRAGRRTWAVKGLTHDKGAARSASAGRLAAPAHTQHAHTYHPTRMIYPRAAGATRPPAAP